MAKFIEREDETASDEFSSLEDTNEDSNSVVEEPVEATQDDDIPEKYKGKSPKEIIRMHQEAEKLLGRQSSEVGELRKVFDEYITTQTNNISPQQVDDNEEVDFFVEPEKAVAKAIENHPEFKQARELSNQMKQQAIVGQLKQAHPDFADILQDTGFQDWVQNSRVRTRLLAEADKNYDFDAADELLTNWKERRGAVEQTKIAQETERKRQLKTASTGTAKGSGEAPSKKIYRRADIIKLMQNDPDRYLSLADEITSAYAEGRVR